MKVVKVCLLLALAIAARAAPVENPEDNAVEESGCMVDGTLYGEGIRVPDGEDPCQVRLCIGGQIQTTPLQCIVRDDCPGRNEPGQCCPSYTHCTSLGKFPQGEAEPYPADAPGPAGQPDIEKEDLDVDEDREEEKQLESSESSESDEDEKDEKSDESSLESSEESAESEQLVEASGAQQDSSEEDDDLNDDAVIEELNLAADDSYSQFDDSADEVEGSASSPAEVVAEAVEQLILEDDFEVLADSEGSGIVADEASEPLTEGSGFMFDLSDKLQLLEVPVADDSAVDLALAEGSGAAASEALLIAVQADESLAEVVLGEGSGAAASAPLVQIEEVAADEEHTLVEGSGDQNNAQLVQIEDIAADEMVEVSEDNSARLVQVEVAADEDQALVEGSGDDTSAQLVQVEQVAADEQVQGSGNEESAPLVLSIDTASLSADSLLNVQQDEDSASDAVVSSGDAADI